MKATRIPDESRRLVRLRDRERCVRCRLPGTDWHHRRSKNVRGPLTHSPCNGIWMCRDCHGWVHSHPTLARESGWIVSRDVADPSTVPVVHGSWGRVYLNYEGGWSLAA